MITLLTPSKTMDFVTPPPEYIAPTVPVFSKEAKKIRTLLGGYSAAGLTAFMQVSPVLANRVVAMYRDNLTQNPALWTYTGDVFKGFQAATLAPRTAAFAQEHLLIASGMYGLLRPYDLIRPYRLEMKAKLPVDGVNNLYAFWGERLGRYVAGLPGLNDELCVLSSEEYAKATLSHLPKKIRVMTPAFIDKKPNGKEGQVPIYNKMMRGVMARWIMENHIDTLDELPQFSGHEYYYSAERSTPDRPVFYRQEMKPLLFKNEMHGILTTLTN